MIRKSITALSAIVLMIFALFEYNKMNRGHEWKEKIELSREYIVRDTIQCELKNARFIIDRKDVILQLQKEISSYSDLYGSSYDSVEKNEEENISNHIYFLHHLDTLTEKFVIDVHEKYNVIYDTISVGDYKYLFGIQNINDRDWERDTFIELKDYKDHRNFYFNSIRTVIQEMMNRKSIVLLEKPRQNRVYEIVLKHHSWGISSYESHYEFIDGTYIIGNGLILGL